MKDQTFYIYNDADGELATVKLDYFKIGTVTAIPKNAHNLGAAKRSGVYCGTENGTIYIKRESA